MKSVNELFNIIYPLVKDKDVLDIGCVEHTANAKDINPFWVHNFLNDNCNVLGLDILEDDVCKLNNKGYNMIIGNAETFELNKKFDVVFAGELIEHLSNPGLFLQQSKKHLRENGLVLVTTPNTFYLPRLMGCVWNTYDDPIVNPEHTAWFSPTTLRTLFEREGLEVLYIKRFDTGSLSETFKSKVKNMFNKIFNKDIKGSLLVIAKVKK